MADRCKIKRVELMFIQPGKTIQNAFMERLNRHYREDVLDAYWFNDPHQIRTLTQKWMEDYNTRHPHSSIRDMPPRAYKNRFGEEFFTESNIKNKKLSNFKLS